MGSQKLTRKSSSAQRSATPKCVSTDEQSWRSSHQRGSPLLGASRLRKYVLLDLQIRFRRGKPSTTDAHNTCVLRPAAPPNRLAIARRTPTWHRAKRLRKSRNLSGLHSFCAQKRTPASGATERVPRVNEKAKSNSRGPTNLPAEV